MMLSLQRFLCVLVLGIIVFPLEAAQRDDSLALPLPAPKAVGAAEAEATSGPLPINLPTALQLADARAIDIAVAVERINAAAAQAKRAQVLWLPTIYLGIDYFRHDGQLQDVGGDVFGTSKSSFMVGAGPSAVFAVTDALFAPLAARQNLRAKSADLQTAKNDVFLAVAEAYINVQQAHDDLGGAEEALRRAEELVRRAEKLAPALIPAAEANRARTERARRRQAVHSARERWQAASAELARILRLDPAVLLKPQEPAALPITLIENHCTVDELIPLALANRPELASQQALLGASSDRLRQEKLRPLLPSLLIRGTSTNPSGTLAAGLFGGGRNGQLGRFSARSDFDVQLLWEFQNLGFGNFARADERRAEKQIALLELLRIQDQIAAEVVRVHAAAQAARARLADAEAGLADAIDTVAKNFEGLGQVRRVGEVNLLVVRPQEVVAAIQALALSYSDQFAAIADFNRAQFRLFRALGQPGN